MGRFDGLPMIAFRWHDRGDCVFNAEGAFKTLAKGVRSGQPPEIVRTRLVPEAQLERWIREGKATRL